MWLEEVSQYNPIPSRLVANTKQLTAIRAAGEDIYTDPLRFIPEAVVCQTRKWSKNPVHKYAPFSLGTRPDRPFDITIRFLLPV